MAEFRIFGFGVRDHFGVQKSPTGKGVSNKVTPEARASIK